MADNGSVADYPEDWFEEEPEIEQWPDPAFGPRFEPGENVKFRDNGNGVSGGYVVGEPHPSEGEWWYTVEAFDSEGPVGRVQAPEVVMLRPESYDQPGATTLEDWLGIPPEGEQYYRTASDPWGDMFEKPFDDAEYKRQQSPFPFIYSPSSKQIHWGEPLGLHDTIINDLAMQGQQVPEDAYFGRYFPGTDEVYIYDKPFMDQPWSEQEVVHNLVRLNAPTRKTAAEYTPVNVEWYTPVRPHVEEEAKYFRHCPTCGGYLEKRGEDVYTCQTCPYELPYGGDSDK